MKRVLFVDDDVNLLAGYERIFRKQYQISTADRGEKGLMLLGSVGPFAVVVADMSMPGLTGIEFLADVKDRSPDTVRIMLTGHADLQTAVAAVNEGRIFRFLTKPCRSEVLGAALVAAIEQYQLITAERELLEKTLQGSVKVLTEIMSLVNPCAFSKALRLRRIVKHVAREMRLSDPWRYELAAMLSQIGCVALPGDLLDRVAAGADLSSDEQEMYRSHPGIAAKLLANIPRLESVSLMISRQGEVADNTCVTPSRARRAEEIECGARILRAAVEFDRLLGQGVRSAKAATQLGESAPPHDERVLSALRTFGEDEEGSVTKMVTVSDLTTSMIADADIFSRNGLLLLSKGQEVSYTVIVRLRNFAAGTGVFEPFRVRIVGNESANDVAA